MFYFSGKLRKVGSSMPWLAYGIGSYKLGIDKLLFLHITSKFKVGLESCRVDAHNSNPIKVRLGHCRWRATRRRSAEACGGCTVS